MTKTIRLAAGTTHVPFERLAHLIADALWPENGLDDARDGYSAALLNLEAELQQAVRTGALPVKNPLTLGPHTFPFGQALHEALVSVDDLRAFVAERSISLEIEIHVVIPACPLSIPAELETLHPDATIRLEHRGINWSSHGPRSAADARAEILEVMDRQAEGFFTVHEAAQILDASRPGIDAHVMARRMEAAHKAGELPIRSEGDRLPLMADERVWGHRHLVLASDVDAWLTQKRAGYGFPMATALVQRSHEVPAPETETTEQRQDRRLKFCVEEMSLKFPVIDPDSEEFRMPKGIGEAAKRLGLSRPTLTDDVKEALRRRYKVRRAGALTHLLE